MVDENYFEDFNRRRPRRSTYRGSYRRPGSSQFFDPSADILAGIESVEKTIGERKKTVRDFENAAAVRRQEMIQSLQDTEAMDDMSAVDSLQASLMQQVDDLYKLDIESFEGDRSAYLKKANEVNRIVQTIPALMGLIDAEATTLDEAKKSGKPLDKSVLRSNNPDYYNFVENASKGGKNISFRIQNGNIIAQLDGKDVFNGNAYVKAKEKGVDLINYAKDYTKQMDEFDAKASKGLQSLVKASKIERAYDDGAVIRTEEKKDYIDAIRAYKKALEDDPNFGALINESTYQTFGNDQSFYTRSNKQVKETKDAMINYMVGQKFKMYNPEDDTAFGDIKVTRDVRSIKKDKKEEEKDLTTEEKFDFSLIEGIQDKSVDAFKNQKEVPDELETKARAALLKDFKNKEIKIGRSKYQIYDFDVMRNDDGTLKFLPLIVDMRTEEEIPAPVTYDVDKINDFATDLEQGGALQYNVIQVSNVQEAKKLSPGSVFILGGKKYIRLGGAPGQETYEEITD